MDFFLEKMGYLISDSDTIYYLQNYIFLLPQTTEINSKYIKHKENFKAFRRKLGDSLYGLIVQIVLSKTEKH